MKSRGRSRLLCFRPVCEEDGTEGTKIKPVGKTKSIADPVFTYISVGISDGDDVDGLKREIVVERRRRIARRILARFVRLKTSQTQSDSTVKHGRQDAILDAEKKAAAAKSVSAQAPKQPCRKALEGDAGKAKAATCSSSFPSPSSSGRQNPVTSYSDDSKDRRRTEEAVYCDCSTTLYLLVISLSVLVLWGRLCAILWTCTCLYFVIRWKKPEERPANADIPVTAMARKAPEMDGSEYRKRVIMEGFLERNHRRV